MMQAKLSSNFKLSIPKAVRDNLALRPGRELVAAEREHRSIANMVAVLIMDHCERNGIPVPEIPTAAGRRTTSRKGDKAHPDKSIGDESENLIIHGDNLHALKALLARYAGKVNCIFIDPPYNTGNENWNYNDNVNSPLMKQWLDGNPVNKEDMLRHY